MGEFTLAQAVADACKVEAGVKRRYSAPGDKLPVGYFLEMLPETLAKICHCKPEGPRLRMLPTATLSRDNR